MLEMDCNLCLRQCSENAVDEMTYERFKEATDFVFTFKISYSVGSNGSKVCHRCFDCIMEFYKYATQVKTNQESPRSFKTEVNEEPLMEELCSMNLKSQQMMSDSENLAAVKIVSEPDFFDVEHDSVETIGDDVDANDSAQSENSEKSLARRRRRNRLKTYSCARCSESFSQKHLLNLHMEKHLDCNACGVFFPDKDSLQEHMKTTHINDGRVMCEKCGKIFPKVYLKTHILTNHTTGPADIWHCKLCTKNFHNSATLRSHIQAIHKEADRTFPCDICQKIYPTSRSLRGHKSRVHVERKYSCSICQKQFKREVNFKEHMAAHTGVTLYECDVCGHKFNSNANMYAHIKRKHPVEWSEKQKERNCGRRRRYKSFPKIQICSP
uniref:C2H2-type domain-containing protein n=2 Tax=Anopheles atroparvus TaxID=41427 RepID=A0AAG5DDZ9_ANOAO